MKSLVSKITHLCKNNHLCIVLKTKQLVKAVVSYSLPLNIICGYSFGIILSKMLNLIRIRAFKSLSEVVPDIRTLCDIGFFS